MHHRSVGPTGGTLRRHGRCDGGASRHQNVHLERPARRGGHSLVGEVVHLDEGVMPVLGNESPLLDEQTDGFLILLLGELVGILDPELRSGRLQVEGGVGDVDRAVVGLDTVGVGGSIGKRGLFEDDTPRLRWGIAEHFGVVHEHVGAPLVGHAVVLVVHRVPGSVLESLVDSRPAGDQLGVDLLDGAAGDEPQAGIARCRHQVELLGLGHEGHHLIGGAGGLDIHHAPGVRLESGHPVVVGVRLSPLDVARPGDDREGAFAFADLCDRSTFGITPAATGGDQQAEDDPDDQSLSHTVMSSSWSFPMATPDATGVVSASRRHESFSQERVICSPVS
jgi:hypothetical protein